MIGLHRIPREDSKFIITDAMKCVMGGWIREHFRHSFIIIPNRVGRYGRTFTWLIDMGFSTEEVTDMTERTYNNRANIQNFRPYIVEVRYD